MHEMVDASAIGNSIKMLKMWEQWPVRLTDNTYLCLKNYVIANEVVLFVN